MTGAKNGDEQPLIVQVRRIVEDREAEARDRRMEEYAARKGRRRDRRSVIEELMLRDIPTNKILSEVSRAFGCGRHLVVYDMRRIRRRWELEDARTKRYERLKAIRAFEALAREALKDRDFKATLGFRVAAAKLRGLVEGPGGTNRRVLLRFTGSPALPAEEADAQVDGDVAESDGGGQDEGQIVE